MRRPNTEVGSGSASRFYFVTNASISQIDQDTLIELSNLQDCLEYENADESHKAENGANWIRPIDTRSYIVDWGWAVEE